MVLPSAKVEPDAGTQFTGKEPSTVSVAVGEFHVTDAPFGPVASAVIEEMGRENQVSACATPLKKTRRDCESS